MRLQEIAKKNNLKVNNIYQLFKILDKSNSGKLNKAEFCELIMKIDNSVNQEEAEMVFKVVNLDGTGVITFKEFQAIFFEYDFQEN